MRMLVAAIAAALSLPSFGLAIGEAAPPFALATATGETVALERLRGKVVYVDFWASWCGPCKRSFPWMNALQKKYGAKSFEIVAVNVDRKRQDAERFLAQTPAEFTVVYDAAGTTPAAWGVKGMPSSYLVDAQGRVVAVEQGFRDDGAAALDAQILALLAGK